MNKLSAFPYYGGKYNSLGFLLPKLPITLRYIEPFGGSMVVLLNRPISTVEVYNDLDGDVVNFFKVLRNDTEKLIDMLQLTPYSNQEFQECKDLSTNSIERARRYFVLAKQSFMSQRKNWATTLRVRNGWGQMVSRWMGGIDGLYEVADRLMNIMIEYRPALEIIGLYNDPDTLFYLDPPYLHSTRTTKQGYKHEMTEKDHQELLDEIKESVSLIAISGYNNELYNTQLKDWFRFEDKIKRLAGPRGKRQEVLWTNYDPTKVVRERNQTKLR